MRTYGRITNSDETKSWVEVSTDANGFDDMVWLTTLCQVFKLNLNESPFYASYGLPAKDSIVQQVAPDYYMALTQQRFSIHFASLIVSRQKSFPPTYLVSITTQQGVKLNTSVQVPT